MKYVLLLIVFGLVNNSFAQVKRYNEFPAMQPTHILDEKLDDIDFALSFRVLVSDYNGPLVRLRRSSDNAQQDFFHGDDDILDISAVNTWRSGSNVYVVKWYDQSGLGNDAIQLSSNQQPRFYPVAAKPYFKGDGSNDHLEVGVGIQQLTNNGVNGTVLAIMVATKKSQHSFGVLQNSDRWSTHINWGSNHLYFDPGICCNSTRSYYNASEVGKWNQYTFMKTDTKVIARLKGVQKMYGNHTTGRCTINDHFGIGWAIGNQSWAHSTNSFLEFVMYKTDISDYAEIEENAILFWSL